MPAETGGGLQLGETGVQAAKNPKRGYKKEHRK